MSDETTNTPEVSPELNTMLESIGLDRTQITDIVQTVSETDPDAMRLGNVDQSIKEWRDAMIYDLGGEDTVTTMERIVVDMSAKDQVILDVIDQFIFNPYKQGIIDIKRNQVTMIVMQRRIIEDSLARRMKDLGFQRRRPQKQATEIVAQYMEAAKAIDSKLDEQAVKELRGDEPNDDFPVTPDEV